MDETTKTVLYLLGGGGLTTIITAIVGWKSNHHEDHKPQAPVPIQIETPWLVQNLLEMKMSIEGMARAIERLEKLQAEALKRQPCE